MIQNYKIRGEKWRQYVNRLEPISQEEDLAAEFDLYLMNYDLHPLVEKKAFQSTQEGDWLQTSESRETWYQNTEYPWPGYATFMQFFKLWTRWALRDSASTVVLFSDELPIFLQSKKAPRRHFYISRPDGFVESSPYYRWVLNETMAGFDKDHLEALLAPHKERHGQVVEGIATTYLDYKILDFFSPSDNDAFYGLVLHGMRLLEDGEEKQGHRKFADASESLIEQKKRLEPRARFRPMLLDEVLSREDKSLYLALQQEAFFEALQTFLVQSLSSFRNP
ncbi:hypothetical protein ACFL4G_08885 [Thermodesulfobacteriota bacterium]